MSSRRWFIWTSSSGTDEVIRCLAFIYLVTALIWVALIKEGRAELRDVEGVGVISVEEEEELNSGVRQAALEDAVRDGVVRALENLLSEEVLGSDKGGDQLALEEVRQKVGKEASRYAVQYRLLRDRGLGPGLLSGEDLVKYEYVMEASVRVDMDLLRDRLRSEGFLGPVEELSEKLFVLKIEGPISFHVYQGFLASVKSKRGIGVVAPILMSRVQIELQVSSSAPIYEIIQEVRMELAEEEVFVFIEKEGPEEISLRIEHNPEAFRD